MSTIYAPGNSPMASLGSPGAAGARIAIGLLQGLVLYLLYRSVQLNGWLAAQPLVFAPLVMVWLIAPVIAMSSYGVLNRRQLLTWVAVAAAILALLGLYDIWRVLDAVPESEPVTTGREPRYPPSAQLVVCSVAGFFIAQSLVMAAIRERRRIAPYSAYFETAWKQFVQLAFSGLFVGVVWMVLLLGSELFMLVKVGFLRRLIRESWFVIPVITFAFSCAMHITDVRPAIVRGIRTLLLVLLSWILPVAVLIIGGFLATLPFTGLEPLWATRSATAVLLGAAAVLIVLINAAYQDGTPETRAAGVVRASSRVAAILLVPVTAIAIYALALRVGSYGWTTSRIIAAACLVVASCYAGGYAHARLRRGGGGVIDQVNIVTAFVVLAILLVLFSPLADPARLSVSHQVARLMSGKVAASRFDYAYLRFEGQRFGKAALAGLEAGASGKDAQAIRDGVAAARAMTYRVHAFDPELSREPIRLDPAKLRVWPKGSALPPSFLQTNWGLPQHRGSTYAECMLGEEHDCEFVVADLTGDGKPEVVLLGERNATIVQADEAGVWKRAGTLPYGMATCKPLRQLLMEGKFSLVERRIMDLDIGGQRVPVLGRDSGHSTECKGVAPVAPAG